MSRFFKRCIPCMAGSCCGLLALALSCWDAAGELLHSRLLAGCRWCVVLPGLAYCGDWQYCGMVRQCKLWYTVHCHRACRLAASAGARQHSLSAACDGLEHSCPAPLCCAGASRCAWSTEPWRPLVPPGPDQRWHALPHVPGGGHGVAHALSAAQGPGMRRRVRQVHPPVVRAWEWPVPLGCSLDPQASSWPALQAPPPMPPPPPPPAAAVMRCQEGPTCLHMQVLADG